MHTKDNCKTALILACSNGNLDIVKSLIEQDLDINAQDINGDTPLTNTSRVSANPDYENRFRYYEDSLEKTHFYIAKYLIEQGADMSTKNNNNETALDIAKKEDMDDIAEYIQSTQKIK